MGIRQLLPFQQILVIENDRVMQAKLQQLFECEGYGVETAGRWAESQNLLRNAPASVLVLDLHAADGNPRRLFEEIRLANPTISIIILGASSSVTERVLFLELGADDYVVKPFNARELLARVRAAMRRSQGCRSDVFIFGDVQVDFRRMEVRRQDAPVPLTAQEFKVLKFMIQHSERPLSRTELLNEVWGYHNYPTTRTVDNHILRLRQKLEREPSYPVHFVTLHGVGYKFVPHVDGRYSGDNANYQRV
jgi:DNA-binding response OmpR family regulator